MLRLRDGFTLVEIMIVILIIVLLLAIAIPNFIRAREVSRSRACQSNLRMLATAKEQWAMDNKKSGEDEPSAEALVNTYIKGTDGVLPNCPSDGKYSIGDMCTWPTCSIGANSTADDETDDHIYSERGS